MKTREDIDIDSCDAKLFDSERVAELRRTGLMGSGTEEAFDRLTFLAAKLLDVPLTIVSFIGDESQYFKSFYGLPEPWSSEREIPIDNSVCRYTLVGDVLRLSDAREHPILAGNPAVPALNLVGYLGVPLITQRGHNLGAFCAISTEVREWSESDVETLNTLTRSVMSEIELKMKLRELTNEREDWEKAIAMLTHDLRGPLVAMQGWAQLGQMSDEPTLKAESLTSIDRSAKDALLIVDDILNWKLSSLNINKSVSKAEFILNPKISELVADLTKTQGLVFNHNLDEVEVLMKGHQNSVVRAVTNLIGNAVKHGDATRPISIRLENNPTESIIAVHNFGEPIPAEDLDYIFEFRTRANLSKRVAKEGWGIGLSLVESVIQNHQGNIEVKSTKEFGTEFTLKFPRT